MELVELDIGAIIREYDIRMDSGGPGKWRGGAGQVLTFEVLKDGGTVLGRGMERMRFAPWGYNGGRAGHPLRAILNRGRADERELRKLDSLAVNAGDTVTFLSPGGGGYGDPFQRDVQAVLQDVRRGFVSRDAALRDFGVAISPRANSTWRQPRSVAVRQSRLLPVSTSARSGTPGRRCLMMRRCAISTSVSRCCRKPPAHAGGARFSRRPCQR